MASKPVTIGPDTDIGDAARLLVTHRIRRLPVVEDNKLIGLLSVADLIHAIAQMKIKEEIKDSYMSTTFALWEDTPLPLVGRVMEISGVDAIPILNSDSVLQGIISERDLIRNSSIEDSVGVSDFSNGTDDDEWTWESIRDNHTISFGISRVQLAQQAGKTCHGQECCCRPQEFGGQRVCAQDAQVTGRPASGDQRGQAPRCHAL